MHRVEAVAAAHEVGGGLGRAADAGELHQVLRLDGEPPAGLHDRRGDRVVAATGAQGRERALVIAPREAERVLRQRGMGDLGFGDESHAVLRAARPAATARTRQRGSVSHGRPLRLRRTARLQLRQHSLDDEARGDRQAVVVQQRAQLRLLDRGLEGEQRAQLRVAVLLHHEQQLVRRQELLHVLAEGEGAHPHVVDADAVRP